MTDWIKWSGGPQPVADDVWVEVADPIEGTYLSTAIGADWGHALQYRILDQDLAHAARLEGIRLGLEAAMEIVWKDARWMGSDGPRIGEKLWLTLRDLNPDTIAREAVLDQLTREAQADNMGYDNEPR